jgi:hypothetical protein
MTGPRRLWSGDWMAESAAERARMAERRVAATAYDEDPELEHDLVAPRGRRSLRELTARARLPARVRGIARGPRLSPARLRLRLILIAVLAGIVGAGAMIGVEAATGAGGPATRPYLGVELGPPLLGQTGAVVEFVVPGGPAQVAGVMVGDMITAVDGRSVTTAAAAVTAVGSLSPGASATLAIERLGAPVTITVTLGSRTAGSP